MKKKIGSIQFVSPIQAAICIITALFAVVCFIGTFFNPFHAFYCVMAVIFTIVTYKEKKW
ncbi:hypothetical protein [Parabacteroides sp. AF17-28]|jgi:hypothetical protein|uniref:hypothetical protein n=1 Tax=Parabacteroides sp. AF17-28 TaxID=2292241 RepID=UPI000F01022B|nr:hypothetical protein [Parabacteroides sp. AF17-28]RHR62704.1 hypothetical protein DWW90_00285 [Parabacteroides sp. AF17-28]